MMTALTTICGMVPVTLSGATSIGLSYTSFGLTLIGGLTTATLLTLLVVPVFYTFFDDAQLAAGRALRHALGHDPDRARRGLSPRRDTPRAVARGPRKRSTHPRTGSCGSDRGRPAGRRGRRASGARDLGGYGDE